MPKIIAFVAVKGGVGKSTLAIAVACEWHRRGVRVALVCVDVKQRSTFKWARKRPELGVTDGPPVIAMAENVATDLDAYVQGFDVVIIDCPGTAGELPVAAMRLADLVVMPSGPNVIEVEAQDETFDMVRDCRRRFGAEFDAVVCITKKQSRTTVALQARAAYDECEFDVLDTELHYRLDYGDAYAAGLGPTTWKPRTLASIETRQLCNDLSRRVGLPTDRIPRVGKRARLADVASRAPVTAPSGAQLVDARETA